MTHSYDTFKWWVINIKNFANFIIITLIHNTIGIMLDSYSVVSNSVGKLLVLFSVYFHCSILYPFGFHIFNNVHTWVSRIIFPAVKMTDSKRIL